MSHTQAAPLLTSQVARQLGVAPETVRLWERLGRISAQRTATGVRLFSADEVARVAREREQKRDALSMKGLDPKAAAEAAESALFNYRRVPWLVDNMRRYGVVPFATFPYKALPATAKAIAHRPAAISRYGHVVRAFEAPRGEQARERSALPVYMQDGWMRLPGNDAAGRVRYLNFEYIVPWGDIGEAFSLSGFLGSGGSQSAFLSVPGANLAAAVVTGIDPFTNQEIKKRPGGMRRYLWDFAVPPLMGSSGRELRAAAKGTPVNVLSRRAQPRSLTQSVIATFFGLRVTPVDIDESRQYRLRDLAFDIEEEQATMRRWARSKWVSEEERDEALAESADRIREIVAQAIEIRDGARPDAPANAQGPHDRQRPTESGAGDSFSRDRHVPQRCRQRTRDDPDWPAPLRLRSLECR